MTQRHINRTEQLTSPRICRAIGIEFRNKDREQTIAVAARRYEDHSDSRDQNYRGDFDLTATTDLEGEECERYQHAEKRAARIRKYDGENHQPRADRVRRLAQSTSRTKEE